MRSCADRGLPRLRPGGRALPRLRPGGSAAVAAALLACSVASPATQVKEALAQLGPVELEADGARVSLSRVAFSDVAVSIDGPQALVVAMVQADGTVRLPVAAPSIGYVGREAFRMERCAARGWCLAPDALGALRGVVAALAGASRPDGARPVAWQVRVERDAAEVGEDWEATERGAPRRLRSTAALARAGKTWSFQPAR